MSDSLSVRIGRVLEQNGIGDPGASLHGWRCGYPDRYGPCDCVDELVSELVAAVADFVSDPLITGGLDTATAAVALCPHGRTQCACLPNYGNPPRHRGEDSTYRV